MTVAGAIFLAVLLFVCIVSILDDTLSGHTLGVKVWKCCTAAFWATAAFVVVGSGYL